jgi:hypothetical protein
VLEVVVLTLENHPGPLSVAGTPKYRGRPPSVVVVLPANGREPPEIIGEVSDV